MIREAVGSSNLVSVGYESGSQVLEGGLKGGTMYRGLWRSYKMR